MSNRREFKWPNVQANGTAKNFAGWDASQLPVEIPPASQADIAAGSNDTKPITSAGLQSVRSLQRQAVSVSGGTLTLPLNDMREAKFENSTIESSNFSIAFSSDSNAEIFTLSQRITGTVVITMPSSVVCEEDNGRWNNGTKAFTVVGGTGSYFVFSWFKLATGLYELRASTKIYTA